MIVDVPGLPLRRRDRPFLYALVDPDVFVDLFIYKWGVNGAGYVKREEHRFGKRTTYLLHRVVAGLGLGDKREVDHLNGDKLDNRRSNLRIATRAENAQNMPSRGGSSRFRGVILERNTGRWRAEATIFYKQHHLGTYATEEEAAAVAAAFRLEHMPFTNEARAIA